MLIPHSEKKPVNFQISLYTLGLSVGVFIFLVCGFMYFALKYSEKKVDAALAIQDLDETEASLDTMRNEVRSLFHTVEIFNKSLDLTLSVLNLSEKKQNFLSGAGGDLGSFMDIEESDSQTLNEINEIRRLDTYLTDSTQSLDRIRGVFSRKTKLLTEVPSLWPVQSGIGFVSSTFGPNLEPFSGNWYIHRGIDIAYPANVPIIATARAKVVGTGYHAEGYGYFVELRHRYGFWTKYGHLQRVYVYEGQDIDQGDVIGLMGNTGRSTGNHLHYEVAIGTQQVDPATFLDMGNGGRKTFDMITSDLAEYDRQ
jgi:murein DD-endopeptidase MepM/ murein hydrolase activator NlpD